VNVPDLNIPAVRRSPLSWKKLLKREKFLQLPAAHDALTAKLIERAGFPAYQIGGFALVGTRYGHPDVDLQHFGEKSRAVHDIIDGNSLPVLVDCDEGYGDAKNITRVVRSYEAMGASAVFIEDQTSPKRCGHMAGKTVIPKEQMIQKVRAAVGARDDMFILARTDAIEPEGVAKAIDRAKAYLDAGADGVYVEGPRDMNELELVGRSLDGVPLATSVLERGGETPWLKPAQFRDLGYTMILYPTTILFRLVKSIEAALTNLRNGQSLNPDDSIDMRQFEDLTELRQWGEIEDRFPVHKH
jgi:2-methylisocitrate lyase-like PEP mutase family enzyme